MKIKAIKTIFDSFQQAKILIKTQNPNMPINDALQVVNPFAAARRQREDLKYAKQQMNVLMDICGKFANMAPTGMKEYIEFNLAAFKAADKAVDLIDKYADKIENALNDIDKLFRATTNDRHSVFNHGDVYNDALKYPNDPAKIYFKK